MSIQIRVHKFAGVLLAIFIVPHFISAQIITTILGAGNGDGGAATNSQLYFPTSIAVDSVGNLFIAETAAHRIRKVDTNNVISTVAGTGNYGYSGDGGLAISAKLNSPSGVFVDGFGNLYFADLRNNRIRKVDATGVITTVAGNGSAGYFGDGGLATNSILNHPAGVVLDDDGNIFISDADNHRIRKIGTNGIITTVISGLSLSDWLSNAYSRGLAVDRVGNLFIADTASNYIRKLDKNGLVTIVAGSGRPWSWSGDGGAATNADLNGPQSIATDNAGNIYIADTGNDRIRKVDNNGIITTVAGGYNYFNIDNGDGGTATNAMLSGPSGIAVDNFGKIFIADTFGRRIRKIETDGIITTVAGSVASSGDGGPAKNARVVWIEGITFDNKGNLYLAESGFDGYLFDNRALRAHRTRMIDTNGVIKTVAGTGVSGYSGDGGLAVNAQLRYPRSVSADKMGNFYIADSENNCIRKVDTNGYINTVAGNGTAGYSGDGGPATLATLSRPSSVFADTIGNYYICDHVNSSIRKVDNTGLITTVAGNGKYGFSGDGGAATNASLWWPQGVAVDVAGNIYIADTYNGRIRLVSTNGIITTISGGALNDSLDYDGGASTNAMLKLPTSVVVDSSGNLYIADQDDNRIRLVTTNGNITTIAGNGFSGFSGDGMKADVASLAGPICVALDGGGNIYIADTFNRNIRRIDTNAPPEFLRQPPNMVQVFPGGSVTLSVATKGNQPLYYQWQYSGVNLIGATNNQLSVESVSPNNLGDYTVIVTNAFGITSAQINLSYYSPYITTIAGSGTIGYSGDGGPATNAKLYNPWCVAVANSGGVYIADCFNQRIRMVATNGIITTIAGNGTKGYSGDGGQATNAMLNYPSGVAVDSLGIVYIAEFGNSRIRTVATNGIITTIAGNGTAGYSGDRGAATNAMLQNPLSVAVDKNGRVYIADFGNSKIRVVSDDGIITTIAGNGTNGYSGDGGQATNAMLNYPTGVAVDRFGIVYIADESNSRIRIVATNGMITTIAGNGTAGYSGDGGAAKNAMLNNPSSVAVDEAGRVYIADESNSRIRIVATNGMITTMAGIGIDGYSSDGGPATKAMLNYPSSIAVDSAGNLYISEQGGGAIRFVSNVEPPKNIKANFDIITRQLNISLTGTRYYPYVLQSTTNLTGPIDWRVETTQPADSSGNFKFTDKNLNPISKFYMILGR